MASLQRKLCVPCIPIVMLLLYPGVLCAAPKTRVPILAKNGTQRSASCVYKSKKQQWRKRKGRRKHSRKVERSASRACKSLLPQKSVSQLNKLPSSGGILSSKFSNFRLFRTRFARTVSGTPPYIADIPDQDILTLFWRDGVVERIAAGNANQDDCNEFYGGNTDGHSAGISGCRMTEQTARSLEDAFRSAGSLCYMKSIPKLGSSTEGITIVSGESNIPEGDFTKIFETPAGSEDRIVELQISELPESGDNQLSTEADSIDQRIFVQIHPVSTNDEEKLQYSFDLYFCNAAGTTLLSHESTTIAQHGKLVSIARGDESEFQFESTLTGYLTEGDSIINFTPLLPRSLEISAREKIGGFEHKSSLTMTPQDQILAKLYDVSEGRRGYAVLGFVGSGLADAQLFEGAYKDEKDGAPDDSFQVAVEFRDSRYLAAPNSKLIKQLKTVNLSKNSFYAAPTFSFNSSAFDCSTTADFVVALDFSASPLQAVTQQCEGEYIENMDFCTSNSTVAQAENNFESACMNP